MNTKKRIEWIDMIRGVMMFLIIISHSGASEIYSRIYTPIFLTTLFFVSGYIFNTRDNFKNFLFGKIKTLVIPLFLLGGINGILAFVADGDSLIYRFQGLILEINSGNDDLWFIASLFTCEILFYFVVVFLKNAKLILISISSISILGYLYVSFIRIPLIWQFETACIMILYLGLGYIYKLKEYNLEKYISRKNFFISLIIYFISITMYNNVVNIHMEIYNNICMFFISSLIGIAFLIIFFKRVKPNKFIIFVGQNTLVYYAFQSKVIRAIRLILDKLSINLNSYLFPLVAMVIVSLVLIVPSIILNKYFPFILGKKKQEDHTKQYTEQSIVSSS